MNPSILASPSALALLTLLSFATGCSEADSGTNNVEYVDADVDPEPEPDAEPLPESCDESCAGCCDGDVCRSGTADDACGFAGAACFDCGARGYCDAEGIPTCEIDAATRWDLLVISGKLPATNEDGGSWDVSGGPPDAFVRAFFNDAKVGETSNISDTLEPAWNEVLVENMRADEIDRLYIEVIDSDLIGDDLISACNLPPFAFDIFDGGAPFEFPCNVGPGFTLTLQVRATSL